MSADNRTVATDALATLGTVIGPNEKRDAIHLGVIPIKAGCELRRGDHVGIGHDGCAYAKNCESIGIVDPFISVGVSAGEWFWLIIYPRVITSLRHVWTHPKIADEPAAKTVSPTMSDSEIWLRNFVASADCPRYETVIAAAVDGSRYDEYLHFDGQDAHGEIPPEFWDHVENVTGEKITHRPGYFSCSC